MKILIATGIYPPAIGGIATYAEKLAEGMAELGHEVRVVTYGVSSFKFQVSSFKSQVSGLRSQVSSLKFQVPSSKFQGSSFTVVSVQNSDGIVSRWRRYAKALKESGQDVDVVIALSSVSVGIPLLFAGLRKPKKILRLGGDFFWERYTDDGGMMSLRAWYGSAFGFWRIINAAFMEGVLRSFDRLVYSTEFQLNVHAQFYRGLPERSVIENAAPTREGGGVRVGVRDRDRDGDLVIKNAAPNPNPNPNPSPDRPHEPFRLLFLGRFVGFKNLFSLIEAMHDLSGVHLTMIGEGPMEERLKAHARSLRQEGRISFRAPVNAEERGRVLREHDLMIIPSVTEISPHTALEALAEGLPVLLTEETGLRASPLILLRPLKTPAQIVTAVRGVINTSARLPHDPSMRNWKSVAREWDSLLKTLV